MNTFQVNQVVPESYHRNVVIISALIFFIGFSVATILYNLGLKESIGPSYGEGFLMLAKLRQDIIVMSIIIYSITILMMLSGIILLTLIYSHRIAGPVYRMSSFIRSVRAGDLNHVLYFRKKDAIHPLADEINAIVTQYKETLNQVEHEVAELEKSMGNLGSRHQNISEPWDKTRKRTENIKNFLAKYSV